MAALTLEDIQETQMGLRVTIKKSKTDQENQGQQIAIYQGTRFKVVDAVKIGVMQPISPKGLFFAL